MDAGGLPQPLVLAVPADDDPDELRALADAVAGGRDADPESARFACYRAASVSWGDARLVARVAHVEELTSALRYARGDLAGARSSWRAGWWIRRLLASEPGGQALRIHADQVMEQLDVLVDTL
jgi:hypothetical protein